MDRDLRVTIDCELDSGFQSGWKANESEEDSVGDGKIHRR